METGTDPNPEILIRYGDSPYIFTLSDATGVSPVDRRWEHLRVQYPARQWRLLASLAESGQQMPIVVAAADGQPNRYNVSAMASMNWHGGLIAA